MTYELTTAPLDNQIRCNDVAIDVSIIQLYILILKNILWLITPYGIGLYKHGTVNLCYHASNFSGTVFVTFFKISTIKLWYTHT